MTIALTIVSQQLHVFSKNYSVPLFTSYSFPNIIRTLCLCGRYEKIVYPEELQEREEREQREQRENRIEAWRASLRRADKVLTCSLPEFELDLKLLQWWEALFAAGYQATSKAVHILYLCWPYVCRVAGTLRIAERAAGAGVERQVMSWEWCSYYALHESGSCQKPATSHLKPSAPRCNGGRQSYRQWITDMSVCLPLNSRLSVWHLTTDKR